MRYRRCPVPFESRQYVSGRTAKRERMIMVKRMFAGILAALVLFVVPTSAGAAVRAGGGKSVCETGSRGDKAYDKYCLTTGTVWDAARFWFTTPEGRKGRERDDYDTRRSVCKFAGRHGGLRGTVSEMVNDMYYDTYRNNKQMTGWTVSAARQDCKRMGYKV